MRRHAIVTTLGLSALLVASSTRAENLEEVIKLLATQNQAAARAQKSVTQLSDQSDDLESEYESISKQADSLQLYVEQLETTVEGQRAQMASLEDQIDRVTDVGRQIVPLMRQMVGTLADFIEVDVPFLMEERRKRVTRLRGILDRSDVTDAEKYRQILEAYQIETDFGRTIEAYQGRLSGASQDGEGRAVNFLRFGRVALVYASLDGRDFGMWNQRDRKWETLPSSYGPGIMRGLRIARKQAAPDLVFLPLPAPVAAE
ncbi:MAG: DUF3450 domain-containing protein [Myxococcota bacterium]